MARARVKHSPGRPRSARDAARTGLLGAPPEDAFDRLAGLARKVLKAPVGMVVAARRPPPPRQELRRAARARQGRARAGHRFLLPARRDHRGGARRQRRARARADARPRDRQVGDGARLRRRPAGALRRVRHRRPVGHRLEAPRLEAGRDRDPPRPRRLGADRDRDARGHRGAQAGRDRAAALDGPPARADGQQPDGDLRQGPRGPLPVPQPRRRAAARAPGVGGDRQARRRAAPARAREPRCASTTRP